MSNIDGSTRSENGENAGVIKASGVSGTVVDLEAETESMSAGVCQATRMIYHGAAEKCEEDGSLRTCEAIVKATVSMEIEEEDQLDTWMGDAESAEGRGKVGTARAILAYALKVFPDRKFLWWGAAKLEKAHGTRDSLNAMLERAVQHCPQAEDLWLMCAKEKWIGGDVPAARDVLAKASDANPESEQIWLATVKIGSREYQAACNLLIRARTVADTERVGETLDASVS